MGEKNYVNAYNLCASRIHTGDAYTVMALACGLHRRHGHVTSGHVDPGGHNNGYWYG